MNWLMLSGKDDSLGHPSISCLWINPSDGSLLEKQWHRNVFNNKALQSVRRSYETIRVKFKLR